MKWNWGSKLLVAMILFMSFIIVLVIQTTKNDVNLVEKDYYPKGLKYQDRLDEIENAAPLENELRFYQEAKQVVVQFPEIDPDTGTIYFFRPSATELDLLYKIEPSASHQMRFPKSEFKKGKYLVKVYWKQNGKGYYIEKPYYFN